MAEQIDRDRFIALLTERFPDIAGCIDNCAHGLLHPEMATLARVTQAAIDAQDRDTVRRHFQFIDEVFRQAAQSRLLESAISHSESNATHAAAAPNHSVRRGLFGTDTRA